MQRNPAYGVPSEISGRVSQEHTNLATVREENREKAQTSSKIRQVLPTLSVIAIILSTIALIVALVCFILIFTDPRRGSNSSDTTSNPWQFNTSDSPSLGGNFMGAYPNYYWKINVILMLKIYSTSSNVM